MRLALIICSVLGLGYSVQAVVMLKGEKISLRGPELKVEDVFSGDIPRTKSTTIVTLQPGERVTLKPHNLRAIAEKWNLDWVPGAVTQEIEVVRQTFVPGSQEILEKLNTAFKSYLGPVYQPAGYEIELATHQRDLRLPVEEDGRWTLTIQSYVSGTGALQAFIQARDLQVPIIARVYPLQEVPVLAQTRQPGEVIKAQDLTLIKVRQSLLDARTVLRTEDLVGTTPKGKPILASVLIKTDQMSQPQLVTKGNVVTIMYTSPVMQISTKGKAMESGGRRDTIRVMNISSKKIIEAEITGVDTVSVNDNATE